jgi:hypothetical protein
MAASPKPFVTHELSHDYHAEAHVLSGHLLRPLDLEIREQGPVLLNDRRGGHFFQRAAQYNLEGLISFGSGYTHVSGHRSLKTQDWVTLATSVLEGLNVLDVITADRMVAQVSTEHAVENGHVPKVTFLGTHFENLRVGGYEVQLELDLGFCGEPPEGDRPYTEDPAFLERLQQQIEIQQERISAATTLPSSLRNGYVEELKQIAEIRQQVSGNGKGQGRAPKLECSLIKSISSIPIAKSYGNVLEIPGFGIASLASVEVGSGPLGADPETSGDIAGNYFHLTMLKMQMGCIGDGTVNAASATANGHTHP